MKRAFYYKFTLFTVLFAAAVALLAACSRLIGAGPLLLSMTGIAHNLGQQSESQ
jgi:hypothetical protein